MAFLKQGIVSADTYNSLPYIKDVSHVPEQHSKDLQDLRALLVKHKAPKEICIRLIHKHFDIESGEAMIVKPLHIPGHGNVSVLRPTGDSLMTDLHGFHFMVDSSGQLQPYEYSSVPLPGVSHMEPFFNEFCALVVERGLQRKFGLKINRDIDLIGLAGLSSSSTENVVPS